jgi:DNA-binding response OmpR family regulator
MIRVLLLEDDDLIAAGLVYALQNEGYGVVHCRNVEKAKEEVGKQSFQMAILDMRLPDGSGFDVSEKLKGKNTPIIFLTVEDDEEKIVKAFDEGAADYVTKPFRIKEFLARVKRGIRKEAGEEHEILRIGEVEIDTDAGKVTAKGKPVELTALEYRVLQIFAANPSKLLTRTQILDRIWDIDGNFVEDNTLTVYVKRLREKLGDAIHIETVRGMGYRVDQ